MRGATHAAVGLFGDAIISTHAPLAGRDYIELLTYMRDSLISTHAPLAGRDFRGVWVNYLRSVNFNPRAPCGARLIAGSTRQSTAEFQPTRPLRGATRRCAREKLILIISTHAPLAGRDGLSSDLR